MVPQEPQGVDLLGTADAAVVIQETWPRAHQLEDRQDEGCGSPL